MPTCLRNGPPPPCARIGYVYTNHIVCSVYLVFINVCVFLRLSTVRFGAEGGGCWRFSRLGCVGARVRQGKYGRLAAAIASATPSVFCRSCPPRTDRDIGIDVYHTGLPLVIVIGLKSRGGRKLKREYTPSRPSLFLPQLRSYSYVADRAKTASIKQTKKRVLTGKENEAPGTYVGHRPSRTTL